jgi:hypothetical protein
MWYVRTLKTKTRKDSQLESYRAVALPSVLHGSERETYFIRTGGRNTPKIPSTKYTSLPQHTGKKTATTHNRSFHTILKSF